jgi:hypothetical protein
VGEGKGFGSRGQLKVDGKLPARKSSPNVCKHEWDAGCN